MKKTPLYPAPLPGISSNGFATKYQLKSAEVQQQVQQHQLDGIKQDIKLNVALRYLDVYERQANLEVARKNYDTLFKDLQRWRKSS